MLVLLRLLFVCCVPNVTHAEMRKVLCPTVLEMGMALYRGGGGSNTRCLIGEAG